MVEDIRGNTRVAGVVSGPIDIALASMPFASYKQPSIGLSLLKAAVNGTGRSARVFYFTIRFAEMIGAWRYDKIATWHIVDLLGDWIFAEALFGQAIPAPEEYIRDVLQGGSPDHEVPHFGKEPVTEALAGDLLEVRAQAADFLEQCVAEITRVQPRILGLTSVFHQHVASLALAKRVKDRLPGTFVVMGGPSCRGIMGLETVSQFPFVDAAVSGDGEVVFPELVRRVLAGDPVSDLPGVFTRDNVNRPEVDACSFAPTVADLDSLPYPDYSDFVEQWESSGLRKDAGRILIETSRGCWWGQKVRCTFCGQASPSLAYRCKSPARAVREFLDVTGRFPQFRICVTDEVVDARILRGLAGELASTGLGSEVIYFQVRPDLKKDEIALLRQAGVRRIEVGIETFSTRVLKLIRKGTSGLRNIAFLKWCRELGIEAVWNLLWGFPGEPADAYRGMAGVVPLLLHLEPPNYVGNVRLDRFSPLFEEAEKFGLEGVTAYPAYRYVYPFAPAVLNNLAYSFAFRYREPQDVAGYTGELADAIVFWKENHARAYLYAVDDGEGLLVVDGRWPDAGERVLVLRGVHRILYLACDDVRTTGQLQEFLSGNGLDVPREEVERLLQPLMEEGLMLREGNSFLSLAVVRPLGEVSRRGRSFDEQQD